MFLFRGFILKRLISPVPKCLVNSTSHFWSMSGIINDINNVEVANMRTAYKSEHEAFLECHLSSKDPIQQFDAWFKEACNNDKIEEGNKMTIATATKEGRPSARMVLLKGYCREGFKFYTNFNSRKGKELKENPYASLVFYWEPLNKQVRIDGKVRRLSEEESCKYFHSRPRCSQIGATVSNQSQPISSRDVLIKKQEELELKYQDESKLIPKPDFWGGYIVIPDQIEFWQGQSNRIHDRIVFRKLRENETVDQVLLHNGEGDWVYERQQP
ncbi:pyridoxine/pyridoxamine 5'-phosphate oxidase-like isoform X2 [Antedon mediterranea]